MMINLILIVNTKDELKTEIETGWEIRNKNENAEKNRRLRETKLKMKNLEEN